MEEYLRKDYGVVADEKLLKTVADIEPYIEDNAIELFEADGGDFMGATYTFMFFTAFDKKLWEVVAEANCEKFHDDDDNDWYKIGEVEIISTKEIPKPAPKFRSDVFLKIEGITADEIEYVQGILRSAMIKSTIVAL